MSAGTGRLGVTEPSAVIEKEEEMNNERSSEYHDEPDRRSSPEQALVILMTTCARRWRVPSSAEEMLAKPRERISGAAGTDIHLGGLGGHR